MKSTVPIIFVEYLKKRRLVYLFSIIASLVLLLQVNDNAELRRGLIVILIMPTVLLIRLTTLGLAKAEYVFSEEGVYILSTTNDGPMNGQPGRARYYLIRLPKEAVISVEFSHWKQIPALLIRTKNKPHGKLVPLVEEDVKQVKAFVDTWVAHCSESA